LTSFLYSHFGGRPTASGHRDSNGIHLRLASNVNGFGYTQERETGGSINLLDEIRTRGFEHAHGAGVVRHPQAPKVHDGPTGSGESCAGFDGPTARLLQLVQADPGQVTVNDKEHRLSD
jgi:hypothetical protein